jgi:DNA-binding FadR family transcriptional regulator
MDVEADVSSRKDVAEIAALARVAEALCAAIAVHRSVPDDLEAIRALLAEDGDARGPITAPQIEALISLGVLGRVVSDGSARLVWTLGRRPGAEDG